MAALPQLALLFSGDCNALRTLDQQFRSVKCRWERPQANGPSERAMARRFAAERKSGPITQQGSGGRLAPAAALPDAPTAFFFIG